MATTERRQGDTEPPAGAQDDGAAGESLDEPHGHSTAAWAAVGTVMLGFLVMSVAVVLTTLWLFVVGAVITAGGGLLGKVLGAMGFGAEHARSVH